MKQDIKEKSACAAKNSCANTEARGLWAVGITVIVLATLFCFAIFKTREKAVPIQTPAAQGITALPGALQAAFPSANCFTCPSFTQCFPPGTSGAQQAAFNNSNCFTSPGFSPCFPSGTSGAQQVALTNPNCFTCPNFTQCFPQGTAGGPQGAPGGLSQGTGGQQFAGWQGFGIRCPFCNFNFSDASAAIRGASRCPVCLGIIPFSPQGPGGLTQVALTQPVAAPRIFRDAVMRHEYRGVCENCHIVMPDIAIPATAQMPHEYRGVCSNCHIILGMNAGAK